MAKINLLQCMEETGWPKDHIVALTTFYLNLKNHPKHQEPDGDTVLLAYQAQVCCKWHIELKNTSGKPVFNISIINDDLIKKIGMKMWNTTKTLLVTRLAPSPFIFKVHNAQKLLLPHPHPIIYATMFCATPPNCIHVTCFPNLSPTQSHGCLNLRLGQELNKASLNSSPVCPNHKYSPYPKGEKHGRSPSPTQNSTPTH